MGERSWQSPMVKMDNIHLAFDGKPLFSNFFLTIGPGEKVILNAPSGRGKSSLVKMMMGFVRPDIGEIFIDSQRLTPGTRIECRSKISYVSQDVDLRDEGVGTLIEEIFAYRVNKNSLYTPTALLQAMDRFDLDPKMLKKQVGELSGGERQRLGFIICLLLDRKIWVLDEVTSALDETLKRKVVEAVAAAASTVVIISHDNIWACQDTWKSMQMPRHIAF
ncbi:ABC transporter ATP-binding protein [Desulforapulum autotrophicum]|nr:ATP-binding cassette domain-containing protein [Desulforapulum autotrophicum]